jgi:predicted Holliday junction resolvase-like endonuclease
MKATLILIAVIAIEFLLLYILIRRIISLSKKIKGLQEDLKNEREKATLKKQLYSGNNVDNFNNSIELLSKLSKPP